MSETVMENTGRIARAAFSSILLILLAIFAMQNLGPVEIQFLDWSFESRRIVVVGGSFVFGLAIGWLMSGR